MITGILSNNIYKTLLFSKTFVSCVKLCKSMFLFFNKKYLAIRGLLVRIVAAMNENGDSKTFVLCTLFIGVKDGLS